MNETEYGSFGAMAFENPSLRTVRTQRARTLARKTKVRKASRKSTVRRLQGGTPAHRIGRGQDSRSRKSNRSKYAALALSAWKSGQPEQAIKALILATNNQSSPRKVFAYGVKRLPQDQHRPWAEFIKQAKPYVPGKRKRARSARSIPGVFFKQAAPHGRNRQIAPGILVKPGVPFNPTTPGYLQMPEQHFTSTSADQLQAEQEIAALEAEDPLSTIPGQEATLSGVFGTLFGADELLDEAESDNLRRNATIFVLAVGGLLWFNRLR
jgi:hypothetical protein